MKVQGLFRLKNIQQAVKTFHYQLEQEAKKRKVDIDDMEMLITIESPFRPRTTGVGSQNRAINGIIQQICQDTGQDFQSTKEYIKSKAVEMGYPMLTRKRMQGGQVVEEPILDWYGNPRGISEADSSVEQCAILIECAIMLASELGITVKIGE